MLVDRLPAGPGRRRADAAARRGRWSTTSASTRSATRCCASLVIAAVTVVLEVILGTNDDDAYTLRVTQRGRHAARASRRAPTRPGIVFLEIDGLALPVLRDAMRDGSAPNMARWVAEDGYRLAEWETDLSSQTGASQAGILLGSNEDIPAFRWVEKESGRMMVCSSPADCAEIERRHATGDRPARRRRREPRQPALGRGRRRRSSPSAAPTTSAARTPATAPSSPTASTSPGRSCCSSGR